MISLYTICGGKILRWSICRNKIGDHYVVLPWFLAVRMSSGSQQIPSTPFCFAVRLEFAFMESRCKNRWSVRSIFSDSDSFLRRITSSVPLDATWRRSLRNVNEHCKNKRVNICVSNMAVRELSDHIILRLLNCIDVKPASVLVSISFLYKIGWKILRLLDVFSYHHQEELLDRAEVLVAMVSKRPHVSNKWLRDNALICRNIVKLLRSQSALTDLTKLFWLKYHENKRDLRNVFLSKKKIIFSENCRVLRSSFRGGQGALRS